jgi:hypothetical protein
VIATPAHGIRVLRRHHVATAVFVFVVFAFVVLAYRNEAHDRQIRDAQRQQAQNQQQIAENFDTLARGLSDNCAARNKNVTTFNEALDRAVLANLADPEDADAREKALVRVAPFHLHFDDCTKYPKPGQGDPADRS